MLQKMKKQAGAIEILYTNRGQISEATTSNIFLAKNGILYTPIEGILEGVTKKTVTGLANSLGYKVIPKIILVKDLYDADEVFLTATNKKVLPIVQVNDVLIGEGDQKGKVGPVSKKLYTAYCEMIKNN